MGRGIRVQVCTMAGPAQWFGNRLVQDRRACAPGMGAPRQQRCRWTDFPRPALRHMREPPAGIFASRRIWRLEPSPPHSVTADQSTTLTAPSPMSPSPSTNTPAGGTPCGTHGARPKGRRRAARRGIALRERPVWRRMPLPGHRTLSASQRPWTCPARARACAGRYQTDLPIVRSSRRPAARHR